MLTDVLTGLAVSGSAAAAVCLLLRRAARGRLSARWEYRMAKLSLVFALVPLGKLVRSFGAAGTGAAASAAPAPHGGTAALPAVFAPADLTPAPAGTLLLPRWLLPEEAVEPQDLKCLLLHELNHVRRRDLWVRLCSAAALIVHWYNPLFHMLDRTGKWGRSAATKTWPSCSTAGSGSGTDRCYCKWPPGTPDKRAPGPCVFLPGRPWKGGSAKCCTQRL